jgi:hypothetical protein
MVMESMTPISDLISREKSGRYCKDVLEIDPNILAVGVLDGKGTIDAADWKKNVDWKKEFQLDEESYRKVQENAASWLTIFLSVGNQLSELFGPVERVSSIHKNFQIVMIGVLIGMENKSVVMILRRSANIGYVTSKVRELLGTS